MRRASFFNSRCLAVSFILGIVSVFVSCGGSGDVLYKEQVFVFGTIVEINIWGQPDKSRQVAAVIAEDFQFLHKIFNPWKGGSLARMNGIFPTGFPFSVSPAILPVMLKSQELSSQSNGLFNPAIGQLVKLWDFNIDTSSSKQQKRNPPQAKLIDVLVLANPTMKNLLLDGISVRSDHKDLALDFGAIAKGYAVDMAIQTLQEQGIKNAIINAGGDLRAIGQHNGQNWRVGIRHPRENSVIASLEINRDESVFTSGDYERFFMFEGKRYHHIIDPRSGYPAKDVISVTVIHSNAMVADAAATALFIAGPQQWHAIAKSMGIKLVMMIDNKMNIYMNPAMAQRLTFEPGNGSNKDSGQQLNIILSEVL